MAEEIVELTEQELTIMRRTAVAAGLVNPRLHDTDFACAMHPASQATDIASAGQAMPPAAE